MELSIAADGGGGVEHVFRGSPEELLPTLSARPRESISIESAPTDEVPLGFRYLYAAPALGAPDAPLAGETRTLVILGMNPNTAATAREGRLLDDATTRDIRALAGTPVTCPDGAPFTRVLFLTMAPFRGIIGKGGLKIADSLDDLSSYRAQHRVNTRIIPAVLDSLRAEEGGLDIVTMWGAYGARTGGRFALAGVRDLRTRLLTLAGRRGVRWYSFGLTASGAPRNYAGLRYIRGMSEVQKALRGFTLTRELLVGSHSDAAWLSLDDPRARMDRAALEGALALPPGTACAR